MAGPVTVLPSGGRTVPQEWIDYNGHMMDAYYSAAFTEATEFFLDHVGLGATYRQESACGIYTAESHVCYEKSVRAGAALAYSTQLLGCDAKRMHVFHRMTEADTGDEVATCEMMFLHVDLAIGRVIPMPPDLLRAVNQLAARHSALPAPPNAGRRIAMPHR